LPLEPSANPKFAAPGPDREAAGGARRVPPAKRRLRHRRRVRTQLGRNAVPLALPQRRPGGDPGAVRTQLHIVVGAHEEAIAVAPGEDLLLAVRRRRREDPDVDPQLLGSRHLALDLDVGAPGETLHPSLVLAVDRRVELPKQLLEGRGLAERGLVTRLL